MQDSLIDYSKGWPTSASTRYAFEIEGELQSAGKVSALPPLKQAETAVRQIGDPRKEPTSYEERRSIPEGIVDLRMNYCDGGLEITGPVPVPRDQLAKRTGIGVLAPIPSASERITVRAKARSRRRARRAYWNSVRMS